MPSVYCSLCRGEVEYNAALAGQEVTCPYCNGGFQMPMRGPAVTVHGQLMPPASFPQHAPQQPQFNPMIFTGVQGPVGSMHVVHHVHHESYGGVPRSRYSDRRDYSGVTVPMLISAIWNILCAVVLVMSIFGIILAPLFLILGIFELMTFAGSGRAKPRALASSATVIGVCEIIAGLFNLVSLVCGIIVLVNAGQLRR